MNINEMKLQPQKMEKPELRTVMGANIRRLRKQRNMSIDDLASIVGVTPSFLGLVERGHRGIYIEKLKYMSELFNVSVDALLGCTKEESKRQLTARDKMINKLIFFISNLSDSELSRVSKMIELFISV